MKKNIKVTGFTIIELLVVIAIIGILAGILYVAIDPAAQVDKSEDAERIVFMNQLSKALDLYALDHDGTYPPYSGWGVHTVGSAGSNKAAFMNDISPYMNVDLDKSFLGPRLNVTNDTVFLYSSPVNTGYRSYGALVRLLHPSNADMQINDGGAHPFYEVGPDVMYCSNKYGTGASGI